MVVPLAGFGFYSSSKAQERGVAQINQALLGSSREVVNKTDDLIDAAEDLLAGLVASGAVSGGDLPGGDLEACSKVLQRVAAQYSKYTNFSRVNRDKFIDCSSGPLPQPKDVRRSANIIEAFRRRSFAVSPLKFGVLTGKAVLVFSQPILGPGGAVVGTLNTGLSLDWLRTFMAQTSRVPGQRMVLLDGQGQVMAGYPRAVFQVGSSIAGSALGRWGIGRPDGVGTFTGENGEKMLASVTPIQRIPGGVFVAAFAPLDPLLVQTRKDLIVNLTLLMSLAGVSLLLGWAGVRVMVLDPIDKLTALARKVEAGDLSGCSGFAYDAGELGVLAYAYDRMIAALDARTDALRHSEAHYRELVEWEDQLVHRFLPDTTEVFVNRALAKFFGGTAQDWVGKKWIDHIHPADREMMMGILARCTPEHPAQPFEHTATNVRGEARWLRWSSRAFFDDQGKVTHFQAVAVDLTDRKHVERNLERAIVDARAANQAKSNFLANMSHELRTPLNSIIGFSEMMSSEVMGSLPDKYIEYANFISSSGHHLLNIISDILDLSKIEAGMLKLNEEQIHLRQEVLEVITIMQTQARKNNNQLINLIPPNVPCQLYGDRMRIKQVLLNVISNALKFTHGGEVKVNLEHHDGATVLTVTDNGIGMTPDELEIALRPFGQVDGQHLNKRYEGTGLGLPLVDQLMEMHGGELTIESARGEGTVVSLRFPKTRIIAAENS